jgi:hypothetical protein
MEVRVMEAGTKGAVLKAAGGYGGRHRHNWIRLLVVFCMALVVIAAGAFPALAQPAPPPEPADGPPGGRLTEDQIFELFCTHVLAGTRAPCSDSDGTAGHFHADVDLARPVDGIAESMALLGFTMISGRDTDYLVKHYTGDAYGGYGLVVVKDGKVTFHPELVPAQPALQEAVERLRDHPDVKASGAFVEVRRDHNQSKTIAIALHLRRAADEAGRQANYQAGEYDSEQISRALRYPVAHVDEELKHAIAVYNDALAQAFDEGHDPTAALAHARAVAAGKGLDVEKIEQAQFAPPLKGEDVDPDGDRKMFARVRYLYQKAFDGYIAEWQEKLKAAVGEIAGDLKLLHHPGNLVEELKIDLKEPVSKGTALEQVVRERAAELLGLPDDGAGHTTAQMLQELAGRGTPLLVTFSGDDWSDIPAFEKLRELREQGAITIGLGVRQERMPQPLIDLADYIFEGGPEEYAAFLKRVADTLPGPDPSLVTVDGTGGPSGSGGAAPTGDQLVAALHGLLEGLYRGGDAPVPPSAPTNGGTTGPPDDDDDALPQDGTRRPNRPDTGDNGSGHGSKGRGSSADDVILEALEGLEGARIVGGEQNLDQGGGRRGDPFAAAIAATVQLFDGITERTMLDGQGGSKTIEMLGQRVKPTSPDQITEGNGELGAQVTTPGSTSDDQQQRHDPVLSLAGRTPGSGGGGQQFTGHASGPGGQPGDPGIDGDPCLAALKHGVEVPPDCFDLKGKNIGDDALEAGAVIGRDESESDPCLAALKHGGKVPGDCFDLKGVNVGDEEQLDAGLVLGHEKDDRCLQPDPPDDCLDVKHAPGDDKPLNMFQPGLVGVHPEANGEDRRQGSAKVMATTAPPGGADKDTPLVSGELESVFTNPFTNPPASSPNLDKLFHQPSNRQPDPILPAWPAPQLDGLQIPQVVPIIPGGGTSALPVTNPWFKQDTQVQPSTQDQWWSSGDDLNIQLDQGAPPDSLFPGAPDGVPFKEVGPPPAESCDAACLAG